MKLHLGGCRGTIWHAERKERFYEPCVHRNRVHHTQCCGVTATLVTVNT
jgi:hypothetical protein